MPETHAELLIEARPEIHVYTNQAGNVVIATIGVRADGNDIERLEVEIPLDCAGQIGKVLIKLGKT